MSNICAEPQPVKAPALQPAKLFERTSLGSRGKTACSTPRFRRNGGARRDRTDDLKLAKLALSQLSYGPKKVVRNPSPRRPSGLAKPDDFEKTTLARGVLKNGGPGRT